MAGGFRVGSSRVERVDELGGRSLLLLLLSRAAGSALELSTAAAKRDHELQKKSNKINNNLGKSSRAAQKRVVARPPYHHHRRSGYPAAKLNFFHGKRRLRRQLGTRDNPARAASELERHEKRRGGEEEEEARSCAALPPTVPALTAACAAKGLKVAERCDAEKVASSSSSSRGGDGAVAARAPRRAARPTGSHGLAPRSSSPASPVHAVNTPHSDGGSGSFRGATAVDFLARCVPRCRCAWNAAERIGAADEAQRNAAQRSAAQCSALRVCAAVHPNLCSSKGGDGCHGDTSEPASQHNLSLPRSSSSSGGGGGAPHAPHAPPRHLCACGVQAVLRTFAPRPSVAETADLAALRWQQRCSGTNNDGNYRFFNNAEAFQGELFNKRRSGLSEPRPHGWKEALGEKGLAYVVVAAMVAAIAAAAVTIVVAVFLVATIVIVIVVTIVVAVVVAVVVIVVIGLSRKDSCSATLVNAAAGYAIATRQSRRITIILRSEREQEDMRGGRGEWASGRAGEWASGRQGAVRATAWGLRRVCREGPVCRHSDDPLAPDSQGSRYRLGPCGGARRLEKSRSRGGRERSGARSGPLFHLGRRAANASGSAPRGTDGAFGTNVGQRCADRMSFKDRSLTVSPPPLYPVPGEEAPFRDTAERLLYEHEVSLTPRGQEGSTTPSWLRGDQMREAPSDRDAVERLRSLCTPQRRRDVVSVIRSKFPLESKRWGALGQLVKESGETPPHAMAQPRRVLMDGLCEPAVLCTGGVGE
ncbi:unnamed protein product [Lampetra planeri]